MLLNLSPEFKAMSTPKQKGAVKEVERVLSDLLDDTRTLREVDHTRFEMTRAWLEIVFSDVLESPFANAEQIESIQSALYRVSCAIYKAQSN